MTLLLVLASPEYLRFFDGAIEQLAAAGHTTHVVVNEAAEYKPVGLVGAGSLPVASVRVIPAPRTFWGDTAFAYRAVVDFLRFLHPDFAAAPVLRERIRRKVLPVACQALDWIGQLPVPVLNACLRVLRAGELAIPVDARVRTTIDDLRPDLVVVSPLVDAASAQVDWIKAARQADVPSALAVASWDNLTNKGLMRIVPDRVLVWNEFQAQEAVRYHAVPPEQIVATGAPVFDRWFDRQPSCTRDELCARAGLRDPGAYLLFTGSSAFIADAEAELAFVRRWLAAVRGASHPAIRDIRVIVRPHPYNTAAWASADLGDPRVAVWPRGAFNPAGEEGRRDFFDSIHHAAAVVGINTSAMIEAAIIGRPVLTVSEFETQEGTLHFHYLLDENGGPVTRAAALDEHVMQLARVLSGMPSGRPAARFVQAFVRPQGLDRPSTACFVDAMQAAARGRPASPSGALPAVLLRPAIAAFGLWVALVARLTSDDPFAPVRKGVLHPVRVARRSVERGVESRRARLRRSARLAGNRWRRADHVLRAAMRRAPAAAVKRGRRAVRQVRYSIGTLVRGESAAGQGKR